MVQTSRLSCIIFFRLIATIESADCKLLSLREIKGILKLLISKMFCSNCIHLENSKCLNRCICKDKP